MRKPIATTALSVALAAGLLLAGCGSDSDGAAAPTTTRAKATTTAPSTTTAGNGTTAPAGASTDPADIAFCEKLRAAFQDYQPHIDDIFTQYGDSPTLAQWASFLPDQVAEMDAMIERVSAVEPSPNLTDDFQAAVEAFRTMSKNFHDSIAAAEAGDQAEFDRLGELNQGTNTPALEQATGVIGQACGFPQG
jgi:hypothetical protein